ncbi:MAG: DUF89 family protein [Candidatus Helarchaeota archaeon]|nr:DUF89 family protein [Candidatus Helarchaeota archaeon]
MKGLESQKVWTAPKCLICLATIAFEILQKSTEDPQLQITGMRETYKILKDFSITGPPTDTANKIYRMIQKLTNNVDPFKDIKIQSNKLAKETITRIQEHVKAATTPLACFQRALAAAIAGNLIDFGTAGHSVNLDADFLEKIYHQIIEEGFAIDHSDHLFNSLQNSKEIIYIADNAGEVYFDLFLLKQLKSQGIKVILVVKGGPIANDATMGDVNDPIFDEATTKIITTGTDALGVSMSESSPEFLDYLQSADIIIAKGQSNFETLYYYQQKLTNKPIYFIFRTKCSSIAQFLGQTVGKNVVISKRA